MNQNAVNLNENAACWIPFHRLCNGNLLSNGFRLSAWLWGPPSRQFPAVPGSSLQWRHNDPDGASNYQPCDCLLNRLFGRGWKKTSKLSVTGLCAGNSPVTGEFPAQRASNGENVSIWWRHHVCLLVWKRKAGVCVTGRKVMMCGNSPVYAWISRWVNNREAGDWRSHYDDILMCFQNISSMRTAKEPRQLNTGTLDNM